MPPVKRPLFRQEALEYQKQKHLGDVVLAQPLFFNVLALLALGFALSLILFAFYGVYTRKEHVQGFLSPDKGLIKVFTPETGVVVEKNGVEGQKVQRGDPLYVISTERGSRTDPESLAAAITRLKQRRDSLTGELAKQKNIDQIQAQGLKQRLHGLEAEQLQVEREILTQEHRATIAAEMLERSKVLLEKQYVAKGVAQQKESDWLDQQGRLQSLQRNKLTLAREIEGVKSELSALDLNTQNQRSAIERNIATLEQELTESESRRNFVIFSPVNGQVTTLLAFPGQSVNASSPLMSILPEGAEFEADLLVPSRAIGFIHKGQTVSLRYQAFPYQRFGNHNGQIIEITRTLINPNEVALPITLKEPVYRIKIHLDRQSVTAYGQEIPLQAGMLLDADIWLDRVRIIDWILEPLYSVKGRL